MFKRYLTKSRYKLAIECPAKLYYTGKPEYADQKLEDTFMESLAEGGFQVGSLAKLYFPNGIEIGTLDHDEAVKETNKLLQKDRITIYEAAIKYRNYFIRADVLVRRGDHIDLIEVKAKSMDMSEEGDPFIRKKDHGIANSWSPYLKDVAFQKHVLKKAFPKCDVTAYLMLVDKHSLCPTDGLNQKFKIVKEDGGRKKVKVSGTITDADLSQRILTQINVDEYCDMIYEGKDAPEQRVSKYEDEIKWYADNYEKDEKIEWPLSNVCAKCEFKTTPEDRAKGLKSGFEECWMKTLGWKKKDFEEPTILDIWASKKKNKFIEAGKYKMKQIVENDISPLPNGKPGLSMSERQWMQIEKVRKNDNKAWIDGERLKAVMDVFVFPLHFIDFETTSVAIPFNKGRHPYEQIAFQYSHHIVRKDGRVEHKGQYINAEPGIFPNYDFVRALKVELENDSGSIFRYSNHENTILNKIREQLKADPSKMADRDELVAFIESITNNTDEERAGERNMIDLCEMEKRYYYDPYTNGSNSIKKVLPAILNSSKYLQDKYSKPIYGAKGGIPSFNYKDWQWLKIVGGKVVEPYKQLPKMFQDHKDLDELLSDSDELKEGGAAAMAYAKLQFEEMSDYERKELMSALLKYCELDTLAMVMIYECWRELL